MVALPVAFDNIATFSAPLFSVRAFPAGPPSFGVFPDRLLFVRFLSPARRPAAIHRRAGPNRKRPIARFAGDWPHGSTQRFFMPRSFRSVSTSACSRPASKARHL